MRGRSFDLLTAIAPAIWGRTSIVTTEFLPNFSPDLISLAGFALIGGPPTYILFCGVSRLVYSVVSSLKFLSQVSVILLVWVFPYQSLTLPRTGGVCLAIASIWLGQRETIIVRAR